MEDNGLSISDQTQDQTQRSSLSRQSLAKASPFGGISFPLVECENIWNQSDGSKRWGRRRRLAP